MRWQTLAMDAIKAPVSYAFVGGPFGSRLTTRDYVEEGVPVIRGNNLPVDASFHDDDFVFVSEKKADDLRSNTAFPGDLVFTQRGTLGQIGVIPRDARFQRYVISQSQMKLTVNPEIAKPRFVYYFFRLPSTVQKVINHALTSGVPHINLRILKGFTITLPEPDCQQRIADILSAYDDLIENNRRRMALLEEAVRQLYREWFVRHRFPGHEHTRITNGVPEGWGRRPLGALASFRLGKMLDEKKNQGDFMPYLANVNVRWGAVDLSNLREMRFEENELAKFGLRYGDIVMCEGGEPGRCALWKEQLPGVMIQKAIHRIRAHPEVSNLFLYYGLRHKGESGELATLFTGATIKHLPREKLALVQLVIPPFRLMSLFADQADRLEKQMGLLEAITRRASQARDLLLPRLMSGEIAV